MIHLKINIRAVCLGHCQSQQLLGAGGGHDGSRHQLAIGASIRSIMT